LISFSALFVWRQEGHPACEKLRFSNSERFVFESLCVSKESSGCNPDETVEKMGRLYEN